LSRFHRRILDDYARIAFRGWREHNGTNEAQHEIQSHENDYIYRYIHKRLHERFSHIGDLAMNLSIYRHIESLRSLCEKNPNAEQRFESNRGEIIRIISEIKGHIEVMNQLELASLLTAVKSYDFREFQFVRELIDMELRWLLKKNVKTRLMDLDLWLYLADIFYECKMRSTFIHVLLNYIAAEPNVNMTNKQIIHMLFLVVIKRQEDGLLKRYEERIYDLLRKASFEDISVISLAYFKTKTPYTDHALLRRLVERTIEHLPTVDPRQPGLAAIVKSIRYSGRPQFRESAISLVNELLSKNKRHMIFASAYNATQILKLMDCHRMYDPSHLESFWGFMMRQLDDFRIKDIQYSLSSLANFSFRDLKPDQALSEDLDTLAKKALELSKANVHLNYTVVHALPLARAMAFFQHYDDQLLQYTSDCLNHPETYIRSSTALEFEKTVLLLRTATHLESSAGNFKVNISRLDDISQKIDRSILRPGSIRQNSLNHISQILRGSEHRSKYPITSKFEELTLKLSQKPELDGFEFSYQYTMPHQNYADLVITRGRRNVGCFDPRYLLPKKVPPGETHVLIFAIHKSDLMDGVSRLSGYKKFTIRLLEKLGYTVLITEFVDPNIEELSQNILRLLK